jgi:hypothetical protein
MLRSSHLVRDQKFRSFTGPGANPFSGTLVNKITMRPDFPGGYFEVLDDIHKAARGKGTYAVLKTDKKHLMSNEQMAANRARLDELQGQDETTDRDMKEMERIRTSLSQEQKRRVELNAHAEIVLTLISERVIPELDQQIQNTINRYKGSSETALDKVLFDWEGDYFGQAYQRREEIMLRFDEIGYATNKAQMTQMCSQVENLYDRTEGWLQHTNEEGDLVPYSVSAPPLSQQEWCRRLAERLAGEALRPYREKANDVASDDNADLHDLLRTIRQLQARDVQTLDIYDEHAQHPSSTATQSALASQLHILQQEDGLQQAFAAGIDYGTKRARYNTPTVPPGPAPPVAPAYPAPQTVQGFVPEVCCPYWNGRICHFVAQHPNGPACNFQQAHVPGKSTFQRPWTPRSQYP